MLTAATVQDEVKNRKWKIPKSNHMALFTSNMVSTGPNSARTIPDTPRVRKKPMYVKVK